VIVQHAIHLRQCFGIGPNPVGHDCLSIAPQQRPNIMALALDICDRKLLFSVSTCIPVTVNHAISHCRHLVGLPSGRNSNLLVVIYFQLAECSCVETKRSVYTNRHGAAPLATNYFRTPSILLWYLSTTLLPKPCLNHPPSIDWSQRRSTAFSRQ
jgi:hypothetical protein